MRKEKEKLMWKRILELNEVKKGKRRRFAEKERLENIAM